MMKTVSPVRVGGRRKLFVTTVLGALVATAAAQGVASAQTRETAIRTLGGPNRFSGPMHSVDDLRTMVANNQTQITSSLSQAGLGDMSTQYFNVVSTGYVSDTTVAPGTHMDWMALKRAGRPWSRPRHRLRRRHHRNPRRLRSPRRRRRRPRSLP